MDFYDHEINRGVARYAREAGWILTDLASRTHDIPRGWKGDGILTLTAFRKHQWLVKFLRRNAAVPIVNMSDQIPELPYPRVVPDNLAIGRLGAEELISRGFEHLGFYAIDAAAPVVQQRLEGFRMAVEKAGRTFHMLDCSELEKRPGVGRKRMSWLGEQLEQLPKPVAIMAQYDAEAAHLVAAALDRGIEIPAQLAIVGADNDPIYCELGPVPLSSVDTRRDILGYEAAGLLDRMMAGAPPPSAPLRIAPTGVMVRRSSDIFAVADLSVRRALGYIGDNLMSQFSVDDVVEASGISRRSLYSHFHGQLGHSIEQEILRQRFNKAKQMLRESDSKLQVIAEQCGFADAVQFSKAFKYHTGVAPRVFRQAHRL